MFIGYRIRQIREQMGFTRDDIQEFSGLDPGYIAGIEQGQMVPSLETLERIAAALAVPLYLLFYAEDESVPSSSPTRTAEHQGPAATRRVDSDAQLRTRLEEVSEKPFDADPAFLLEYARRTTLGRLEN